MKEKKKNLKTGITLVALVITIVIMLILASVTIGAINGGLFDYAGKAKTETEKAQYIEALQVATLEANRFAEIKSKCQKNIIFENATYTEYLEDQMLIVKTKENYQFLVTKKDVKEIGYIDVTNNSLKIYPDYYIQGEQKTTYSGKSFIITGTTTFNTVEIYGDKTNTFDINIYNLSVQVNSIENTCAFNIKEGANINLHLMGTNTFKSGSNYAGLQKSSKDGTLTIDGDGILTANGGYCSAGIGGGNASASVAASCTNIIINSGIITANSGNNGSGIGAGYSGSAIVDNIQINGGVITAAGANAGIGTARKGASVSNIKITGGKVKAYSSYESVGIGGANLSDVEISGGSLDVYTSISAKNLPAIGSKSSSGTVENILITGGNAYIHSGSGSIHIGSSGTEVAPTNKDGEEVLQTIITLSGVNTELQITNIEFEDFTGTYGIKDMYTRNNGNVYLYLPAGAKVASITAGGSIYTIATPIEAGTSGTLTK